MGKTGGWVTALLGFTAEKESHKIEKTHPYVFKYVHVWHNKKELTLIVLCSSYLFY